MPKLRVSGLALRQPIQKLFPSCSKPDYRPLPPFYGEPGHCSLTSRPRNPTRCPLAVSLDDLPSGPPSLGLHPLGPPFNKSKRPSLRSRPGSKALTPSSYSDDDDITGIQKDMPAVSCSALTELARYQRLFQMQ